MALDRIRQLHGLDVEQGLKNCMDDESLYLSIIEMYINQLQENLPELEELFNTSDWAAYGRTCHAIKGASASVGACQIQEFSARMEAAGKSSDAHLLTEQHASFTQLLQSTVGNLTAATQT